ncbi:MAG: alpha-amylase family glycosyl hydrolase [Bacteroidota bacterium]
MGKVINIYQIFTRLFANQNTTNKEYGTIEENGCTKFNDITSDALHEIKKLGITHVWFTGIIRHATCTDYSKHKMPADNPHIIKGRAGSPYAIKDYFDVHPDYAVNVSKRMEEFEQLLKRTHDAGLQVLIDFVPNHVSRTYESLKRPAGIQNLGEFDDTKVAFKPSNNFYYIPYEDFILPKDIYFPYTEGHEPYTEYPAKATGNDVFSNQPSINDWYETVKLNYGIDYQNLWHEHFEQIPDTWVRMYEILEFWAHKGVDGFRCDMAEMVPVKFWAWVIPQIKEINPDILFIAEVYNPDYYKIYSKRGKFDYLYDKVGLYDVLRLIIEGYGSAKYISDVWRGLDDLSPKMLRFLENHDEQRIASDYFAVNPENAKAAMIAAATLHSGPLMLYFGQEIGEKGMDKEGYSGQDGKTSIFDYWGLSEFNKWVNNGKFDGGQLSTSQKELREFYKHLLQLRLKTEALRNGMFYDLMWQNYSGNVNSDKIFAFVRYTDAHKLIIIINFDLEHAYSFKLMLGEHAFETIGIPSSGTCKVRDIYEGTFSQTYSYESILSDGMSLDIPKNSALILEIQE